MRKYKRVHSYLSALCLAFCCFGAGADELLLNYGGGPQPGADQRNSTVGFDYSFYRLERSERQHLLVGVGYTRLRTDDGEDIHAVSVYPQLSLYPPKTSWISARSPTWAEPFFFVRALGPTYISDNRLGARQQGRHFSFQAQVGVGVLLKSSGDRRGILTVSWKHFSNANLYSENDGIDLPVVVNVGVSF